MEKIMERISEQTRFEIEKTIDQKPFESKAVESFFAKWCDFNDSIVPKVVDRQTWDKQSEQNILEKRSDGKQTLYIPADLQLWEVIGIIETVDNDTFADKPERREDARPKILELGNTFKNAGIYILQRLHAIDDGQEIASALAEEFYTYGQALISGEKLDNVALGDMALQNLTAEETDAVDRFLAGDDLYQSRRSRAEISTPNSSEESVEQSVELFEAERQKSLAQFFRVSEKAFKLQGRNLHEESTRKSTNLKPWQNDTPIHNTFISKVEKNLRHSIETPRQELEAAIFRRGLEKLVDEMTEPDLLRHYVNRFFSELGIDLRLDQQKLADKLGIRQLRSELETLRLEGNIEAISQKEREIADSIQREVGRYPFRKHASNPSEIIRSQFVDCVGASLLGGAMMQEAGLNYLVGSLPDHALLFLVTSDNQLESREMLAESARMSLTDEMITSNKKDGSPLTVSDIVALSRSQNKEDLMFEVAGWGELDIMSKDVGVSSFVTVSEPELGHRINILTKAGISFIKCGMKEEAFEAFRHVVDLEPKSVGPYVNVGMTLIWLHRYSEALEMLYRAVVIDPQCSRIYLDIGRALEGLGRSQDALDTYRRFLDLPDAERSRKKINIVNKKISNILKETAKQNKPENITS